MSEADICRQCWGHGTVYVQVAIEPWESELRDCPNCGGTSIERAEVKRRPDYKANRAALEAAVAAAIATAEAQKDEHEDGVPG